MTTVFHQLTFPLRRQIESMGKATVTGPGQGEVDRRTSNPTRGSGWRSGACGGAACFPSARLFFPRPHERSSVGAALCRVERRMLFYGLCLHTILTCIAMRSASSPLLLLCASFKILGEEKKKKKTSFCSLFYYAQVSFQQLSVWSLAVALRQWCFSSF